MLNTWPGHFPAILTLGIFTGPSAGFILKKIYAMAIIVIFTLVHRRGVRFGARVQNSLTLVKIAGIILFVAVGFAFGKGDFGHLFQGRRLDFNFIQCKSIGLSFLWIMFAYSGWNASAYIGSEIRTPKKNLPRSLILGTAVVIILYLALNLLYVYAIPINEISGTASIGGLAAAKLFGRSLEQIISVFIAFALFSSLSAYIMLGPRVYFSMARDGFFFRFAARSIRATRFRRKAILFQGADRRRHGTGRHLRSAFDLSRLCARYFPDPGRPRRIQTAAAGNGQKTHRLPVDADLFHHDEFLMLIFSFLERPRESLVAIVTLLLGIPLYFLVFREEKMQTCRKLTAWPWPILSDNARSFAAAGCAYFFLIGFNL